MRFGLLNSLNHKGFETLAVVYGKLRDCEDIIKITGKELYVPPGKAKTIENLRVNPAVERWDVLYEKYVKLAAKFGFTPSDQANMDLEIKDYGKNTGKERFFVRKFGETA